MLVMSPSSYIPAWELHDNSIVPLWSVHASQTIEIPDIWKEVRVGERACAIHHVKLPASTVIPPLSENVTSAPLWADYYYRIISGPTVSWWESGDNDHCWEHCFYPLLVEWAGEMYSAIVNATVRYYSTKGSNRRITITAEARFITLESATNARRTSVSSTATSTVRASYPWAAGIPDPSEIEHQMQLFLSNVHWQTSSSNTSYRWRTLHPWDAHRLSDYVMSFVSSARLFEDDALVEDHTSIQRNTNPLSSHYGEWESHESRGAPLWVHSDCNFQKGKALAYLDALSSMKVASQNMLQNIASVYQVLTSFAFQPEQTQSIFQSLVATQPPVNLQGLPKRVAVDMPEIPELAKNAWLGGRYVFSTSVSDLGQGWSYFYDEAQRYLGNRSNESKCHGSATVESATFSCTFVLEEKALQGVNKYFETLYKLGLEPNAYVMWDFVPYSFVVDWFIPIGDALNTYVVSSHYTPQFYNYLQKYGPYSMCYSVKYNADTPFGQIEVYTRWYEHDPPNVDTSYVLLEQSPPSDKTACWRFVDGLCLVL